MECKNSLDADNYAEREGVIQLEDIALEERAEELYSEIEALATEYLPEWALNDKLFDVLYIQAMREAKNQLVGGE